MYSQSDYPHYLGRNEIGKQINKYTTWFAPDGLTPAKALKAAEQAAEEWEQRLRKNTKEMFLTLSEFENEK